MTDVEIVIKIPEKDYESIKGDVKKFLSMPSHKVPVLYEAINKGIVLPKGHKRLIEDNFDVGPVFDEEGNIEGYRYITREDLDNADTIVEADDAESEDNE